METLQHIATAIRCCQVVFAIICLGTSAYWIDWLSKLGRELASANHQLDAWSGKREPDSANGSLVPYALGFAIFASVTGAALSGLMLAAPHVERLHRTLFGFFDFVTSWIWSDFFLAVFSAMAPWLQLGISENIYNTAVAMSFLLFVAYAATAVLALLDMRSGKGPAWANCARPAGPAPAKETSPYPIVTEPPEQMA